MAPAEVLGRAFGLEVEGTFAIPALGAATPPPSRRRAFCRARTVAELERGWDDEGSHETVELRYPEGRLFLSIRSHPDAGYRIWAPRHGRHLVSADGTKIQSALPRNNAIGWQRLFFAQTLPLAAVLQGLEVLHASAVALGGAAVAFTAPSGAGKSSLAAHLVAAGATFLTDDVLAVEARNGVVEAHPGPARTSVSARELRAMTRSGRVRLGARAGTADGKLLLEPEVASGPHPLVLLYRVLRSGRHERASFREHDPPEPVPILGSSFLPYLQTPQRLRNQLTVCDRIVSTVRTFDFAVPASVSARDAAALVLEHSERALSR